MALTYTDADDNVIDLDDDANFFLDVVRGAGIPMLSHDTVKTPARDGETWKRVQIEPRFLLVQLVIRGSSWANHLANRLALVAALNPKLGMGTLKYTPDATLYAIDCILERGVDFSEPGRGIRQDALISFRCPDPTWYDPTLNEETVANTGSGLSVPITVPLSFADGTGTTIINNTGHVASYPVITIPGACTNPIITNTTTGKKLSFPTLTINAGQSLVIDCDARTAVIGSVSQIAELSSDSEFWTLEPGSNTITFGVASGTVTADVDYYTRFLGL